MTVRTLTSHYISIYITINGYSVERTNSIKYLGIKINIIYWYIEACLRSTPTRTPFDAIFITDRTSFRLLRYYMGR